MRKLFSKAKKVILPTSQNRGVNNTNGATTINKTDENLTDRVDKFGDLISQKNTFSIALRFLTDISLIIHNAPFLQCEQFKLTGNFRQYLETRILL